MKGIRNSATQPSAFRETSDVPDTVPIDVERAVDDLVVGPGARRVRGEQETGPKVAQAVDDYGDGVGTPEVVVLGEVVDDQVACVGIQGADAHVEILIVVQEPGPRDFRLRLLGVRHSLSEVLGGNAQVPFGLVQSPVDSDGLGDPDRTDDPAQAGRLIIDRLADRSRFGGLRESRGGRHEKRRQDGPECPHANTRCPSVAGAVSCPINMCRATPNTRAASVTLSPSGSRQFSLMLRPGMGWVLHCHGKGRAIRGRSGSLRRRGWIRLPGSDRRG